VTATSGSAVSTSSIKVAWSKPACDGSSFVKSYNITSTSALIPAKTVAVVDPLSTAAYSWTFTGLQAKTKYTVTIRAVNAAGSSQGVDVAVTTK
jgi:hypothetical protein